MSPQEVHKDILPIKALENKVFCGKKSQAFLLFISYALVNEPTCNTFLNPKYLALTSTAIGSKKQPGPGVNIVFENNFDTNSHLTMKKKNGVPKLHLNFKIRLKNQNSTFLFCFLKNSK